MGNQQTKTQKEKQEEEKKKILQKHGILIPPSFGTGTDTLPGPTKSNNNNNKKQSIRLQSNIFQWIESQRVFGNTSVDVMKYSSPSIRLLDEEYGTFGFWLNVNTSSSSIAASLYKPERNNDDDGSSSSLLSGEMAFGQLVLNESNNNTFPSLKGGIGVKVYTTNTNSGSAGNTSKIIGGGFVRHDPSGLGVFMSLSDHGMHKSCIGWNLLTTFPSLRKEGKERSDNDPTTLWLGSSLQLKSPSETNNTDLDDSSGSTLLSTLDAVTSIFPSLLLSNQPHQSLLSTTSNNNKNPLDSISDIKTWLAMKALNGSLKGAMEVNTPFHISKNAMSHSTIKDIYSNASYFLSYQLASSNHNNNTLPPITFTTYNTPSSNSFILSQIFYYDRKVVNPIEDRCPKIRNTISWAMKMEKEKSDSSNRNNNTATSAAFAWQMNRNITFKSKLNSNGIVSMNLLIKRWAYPRITTSILTDFDFWNITTSSSRVVSFQGIGMTLETGSSIGTNTGDDPYVKDGVLEGRPKGPDMRYQLVLDNDDKDEKKHRSNSDFYAPPSFV